jgi:nicotinate phosphoribosyltransferase
MTLCPPPELLTDRYQLTMAASYLAQGTASDRVAFELFVRELPHDRGYLVAAGLETAERYLRELHFDEGSLDYLERSGTCTGPLLDELRGLRFDGDLDAMPEGTVAHATEPLLRIEGPRLVCQLVESYLLNQVNFQTLIANKAAPVALPERSRAALACSRFGAPTAARPACSPPAAPTSAAPSPPPRSPPACSGASPPPAPWPTPT